MKKVIFICFLFFVLIGCSTLNESSAVEEQSGVELWTLHCSHCHNIPNPADYNASQWEVVGTHMRIRANINGKEIEKIVAFLQTNKDE